jgi:Na+/proline symporter
MHLNLTLLANEQVLLFGVMAIEIKRKAPHAHTVCEIVKARYDTVVGTNVNKLVCYP